MMKNNLLVCLLLILFSNCKDKSFEKTTDINTIDIEDITTSIYPEAISAVFDAHGGIDRWNTMTTLSFAMDKPNGIETTLTNLKSRAERIETPTFTMGYDGQILWVNEKDGNEYKGNALFYKGLMMYFYAMPFILGDSGIIYEETSPLTFNGKTYPGILISYEAGVGESPDDQYKLYYNPETFRMEWLAYTVTFGKNEKSKNFSFIRYDNWQTINELLLPKSISWYTVENDTPSELKNTVEFEDIILKQEAPDTNLFIAPESAKIIE